MLILAVRKFLRLRMGIAFTLIPLCGSVILCQTYILNTIHHNWTLRAPMECNRFDKNILRQIDYNINIVENSSFMESSNFEQTTTIIATPKSKCIHRRPVFLSTDSFHLHLTFIDQLLSTTYIVRDVKLLNQIALQKHSNGGTTCVFIV